MPGSTDTLIINELTCDGARADVVVVNGELSGYEIKSDRDTLDRLANQQSVYSRVFDRVILVVGSRHIDKARSLIPDWWGLIQATRQSASATVTLTAFRDAERNPAPDPWLISDLLWRDEMLRALEERGLDRGVRSKPRRSLRERLATLDGREVGRIVRQAMKRRDGLAT